MKNEAGAMPDRQMEAVKSLGAGLFELGQVVATPGALALMASANTYPATFLAWHVHGEWGDLELDDRAANDRALATGERILSAYTCASERLWVITEAKDDQGKRASTCILLPEEY